MKKKKFKHPFTYDSLLTPVERVDSRSMTVPGRSLSIAEIMQRSAAGIPTPANSSLEYGDDEDFDHAFEVDDPLIDAFDAAERTAALRAKVEEERKAAQEKLRKETPKPEAPQPETPKPETPQPQEQ